MRCEEARVQMLSADPSELAGEETTSLASHLAACPACRQRAAVLLDGQSELARALERMSRRDVEWRKAERAGGADRTGEPPFHRLPRFVAGATGAALVAAAALLVWWKPPGFLSPTGEGGEAVVSVGDWNESLSFGVDVSPDGRMAVLQTGDPRFVVVWQYEPTY